MKHTVGLLLMSGLLILSNAGGISGAGSTVPIMLICFDQTMLQAVPLAVTIAVCSSTLRYVLNFFTTHPRNPQRTVINYDIVQIGMPAVFVGSLVGVEVVQFMGNTT